jgi:hypothetical protein
MFQPQEVIWTHSAKMALNELSAAPLVRFPVLALSSIFFLVDSFAATPHTFTKIRL